MDKPHIYVHTLIYTSDNDTQWKQSSKHVAHFAAEADRDDTLSHTLAHFPLGDMFSA